jgi:hypothetical protein
VNMFNKQSRTTEKRWSSSFEFGRGTKKLLTIKKKVVTKCHKEPRTSILLKWPKQVFAACYHSVTLLSSRLLSKNIKIRI